MDGCCTVVMVCGVNNEVFFFFFLENYISHTNLVHNLSRFQGPTQELERSVMAKANECKILLLLLL